MSILQLQFLWLVVVHRVSDLVWWGAPCKYHIEIEIEIVSEGIGLIKKMNFISERSTGYLGNNR